MVRIGLELNFENAGSPVETGCCGQIQIRLEMSHFLTCLAGWDVALDLLAWLLELKQTTFVWATATVSDFGWAWNHRSNNDTNSRRYR